MFAIEQLDYREELGFWSWFKKLWKPITKILDIGSKIISVVAAIVAIF